MEQLGNPNLTDFNRWQPLLEIFIDQSGNEILAMSPALSPEWAAALRYRTPTKLPTTGTALTRGLPRSGHTTAVANGRFGRFRRLQMGLQHSDHVVFALDPTDGVMIDISPATSGNRDMLPTTLPITPASTTN